MKMNYIKFGTGLKTLIIIPGISIKPVCDTKAIIESTFKKFTTEYTIFLFDRRTDVKNGHTIFDMAGDVYNLMNELGISFADFYGASQGGMIILSLAIKHPEVCGKIVLASTLARDNKHFMNVYENWIRLAEENNKDILVADMIDHIYGKDILSKYRNYLIGMFDVITDDEISNFIINAKGFRGFDCYSDLDKIKNEVFVVGSKGDNVTTLEGNLEIIDKLSCKSYIYPDNYGHAVYDEAKDFIDKMYEFLIK